MEGCVNAELLCCVTPTVPVWWGWGEGSSGVCPGSPSPGHPLPGQSESVALARCSRHVAALLKATGGMKNGGKESVFWGREGSQGLQG